MKRITLLYSSIFFFMAGLMSAQVGINTENPQATLDIKKDFSSSTPNGLLLPYMTVAELNDRESQYSDNQEGILVFVTDVAGATGKTELIKKIGIHYYDTDTQKWIPINIPTSPELENIYNTDGTLESNRNVNLNGNNLVYSGTGNVGIGTTNPTNKLHIVADDNPLRLENVAEGDLTTDKVMVLSPSGIVRDIGTPEEIINRISTPTPTLLVLDNTIRDFLSTANAGNKEYLNMSVIKNEIPGMIIDNSGSGTKITLPAGTYQITLVYEAYFSSTGSLTGVQVSSYFVDFPGNNNTNVRIHSTVAHMPSNLSNHGSEVTYVTKLDTSRTWTINLGRGQSGTTTGISGLNLVSRSTELIIYRMGD